MNTEIKKKLFFQISIFLMKIRKLLIVIEHFLKNSLVIKVFN